jgi:hypothetical protein
MPNIATITGVLSAAVATGGTIVANYPTGTTRGDFVIGMRHRLSVIGKVFSCPEDITVSLGNTAVTVTYNGATTLPSGSRFTIELDRSTSSNPLATTPYQADTYVKPGQHTSMFPLTPVLMNLGTPTTASATAVCAAQAVAAAGFANINGAKAAGGVASLGAPTGRNVNVVSSAAGDTTQTVTIRGLDMYGNRMQQTLTLNGTTTVQGTKAFASVTSVQVSAALAGNLSVGDGAVLGLPAYLSNATFIARETLDGAVASAGTTVAGLGIAAKASATNGDVRGTYAPASAPDGSRSYALVVDLPEPNFYGQPQFFV